MKANLEVHRCDANSSATADCMAGMTPLASLQLTSRWRVLLSVHMSRLVASIMYLEKAKTVSSATELDEKRESVSFHGYLGRRCSFLVVDEFFFYWYSNFQRFTADYIS